MSDRRLVNQPVNRQLQHSNSQLEADGVSNEAYIQQTGQTGMLVASNGDGPQTFVKSEELKMTAIIATRENEQLRAQITTCNNSMRQKIAEIDKMKAMNRSLTHQFWKVNELSRTKVLSLNNKIEEYQRANGELRIQNEELRQRNVATGKSSSPPVPASVQVIQNTFESLRQTVGNGSESLKPGDRESYILEKLQSHIKRAEEILLQQLCNQEEVELAQHQGAAGDPRQGDVKMKMTLPVAGQESPNGTQAANYPLSPTGQQQQAYNQSMQNMLSQLDSLRKQMEEKNVKLNQERERVQELESHLEKARSRVNTLESAQDSNVAAAVERQREEDNVKHQDEMKDMMAKLDELTLLAAEKYQKEAYDEEPRYHSASYELKQQVTSLVAELELKEKCLDEERQRYRQQAQMNDALQLKVRQYHDELQKSRHETKSYIDTLNIELKRRENLYQAERQKALHERIQSDKCKEELEGVQAKLDQLHKANSNLNTEKKRIQEKEDRLVAEVLSAEEAIEAKDHEARKYEKQVKKLSNDLHIWQTQTEVCQRDFQEERLAREQMHTEKLNLQGKLDAMQREKDKMEEELQFFHRQQLHQVQDRYRPAYGGFDRGGTETFAPRAQVYEVPGEPMDEAGIMDQMQYHREPTYGPYGSRQPQQEQGEPQNWCPKCQQTFPDFDTLQIHVRECID